MDGVRVCHTEWSKSEKEKQIPYANSYIWNLRGKKSHEEPSGKTGIKTTDLLENGLEDMGRGKGKMWQRESGMDIYTLPNVK